MGGFMALSPNSRFGSYEVLSPIGAGGMGEVYAARDTFFFAMLPSRSYRQNCWRIRPLWPVFAGKLKQSRPCITTMSSTCTT